MARCTFCVHHALCCPGIITKFVSIRQQSASNTVDVVERHVGVGVVEAFIIQGIVSHALGGVCIDHLHLCHALSDEIQSIWH